MRAAVFSVLVVCALAARIALEPDTVVPPMWARQARVSPKEPLRFTFALKLDAEALEARLKAVSDPKSAEYGNYLKFEDLPAAIGKPEAAARVSAWLAAEGVEDVTVTYAMDAVVAVMPAAKAETLLETKFFTFKHKERSEIVFARAVTPYTLPAEIAADVEVVGGVSHFPKIHKTIVDPKPDAALGVDPHVLRAQYAVGDVVGNCSQNSQAVAQFLGQFMHQSDLDEFILFFAREASGVKPTIIGPNSGLAGVEASLDIQYIMGVASQVDTTFWSTGGLHLNQEPFLDWLYDVGNTTSPPWLFSVSYGDDEDSLTRPYMHAVNNQLMVQGQRGISIMFASGDSGVGCGNKGDKFIPNFPASSPWVTAVGGTALGVLETGNETVNGLSGGGFSNVFPMPWYQTDAVANYMTVGQDMPNPKYYNGSGRAYPDVSALSSGFVVVTDLVPMPGVAGTSCASPTFSAVMSLVNDARLCAGKPSMGFLNPFIYSTAAAKVGAFFDVTVGGNPQPPCPGFFAAPGWDPASGVGTPIYTGLLDAAMKL